MQVKKQRRQAAKPKELEGAKGAAAADQEAAQDAAHSSGESDGGGGGAGGEGDGAPKEDEADRLIRRQHKYYSNVHRIT